MSKILISNATIVTMNPSRDVFNGDMYIENNRIQKIGKNLTGLSYDKKIDARGDWIFPGFIQTHVHLCQTLFRNQAEDLELLDWLRKKIWPMEGNLTKKSLKLSATLGVMELLKSGTTTILDMGTVYHTDAIFEVCEETGIRTFCGKAMMDQGIGIPKSLKEETKASLKETERLIKKWHGKAQGRLQYALAPRFVLSCSRKLLEEVQKLSEEGNLIIHTHVSENQKETKAVFQKFKKRNIEYLFDLGLCGKRSVFAHAIWINDDELYILAKTKTNITHCPSSNLKLGSGIAKVPEMLKYKINVSLGADGAPCNNNLNIFQEMRLAGLIQKPRLGVDALPAQKIVEMATLHGAKALDLEKEIGSIEVGKYADLVIVKKKTPHSFPTGDPYTTLVYATEASDVQTVLVDGKMVVEEGKIKI